MYVLCSAQNKDAVRLTLEQIDVVKRMCNSYEELELVTTSQGDALSFNRHFLKWDCRRHVQKTAASRQVILV